MDCSFRNNISLINNLMKKIQFETMIPMKGCFSGFIRSVSKNSMFSVISGQGKLVNDILLPYILIR